MLVTRSATSNPVDKNMSNGPCCWECNAARVETESRAKETEKKSKTKQSRAFHIQKIGAQQRQDKTRQVEHYVTASFSLWPPSSMQISVFAWMPVGHPIKVSPCQTRRGQARRVEGSKRESLSCFLPATHARSRCLICDRTMAFWCWLTHLLPKPLFCLYSPSTYRDFV